MQNKHVLAFETWIEKGEKISRPENAAASVAMVQATGSNREEAILNAESALSTFNLRIS